MSGAIDYEPHPAQEAGDQRANALLWMDEHPAAMIWMRDRIAALFLAKRRVGMQLLIERLRWEWSIERGDWAFKINNNFAAHIGRELVRRHPYMAKVLTFRRMAYDPKPTEGADA